MFLQRIWTRWKLIEKINADDDPDVEAFKNFEAKELELAYLFDKALKEKSNNLNLHILLRRKKLSN